MTPEAPALSAEAPKPMVPLSDIPIPARGAAIWNAHRRGRNRARIDKERKSHRRFRRLQRSAIHMLKASDAALRETLHAKDDSEIDAARHAARNFLDGWYRRPSRQQNREARRARNAPPPQAPPKTVEEALDAAAARMGLKPEVADASPAP